MRKHVTPADPAATIPDPERGRALPPEGAEVTWSPYWAGLAARQDVTASDVAEPAEPASELPAEPPPAADPPPGAPAAA